MRFIHVKAVVVGMVTFVLLWILWNVVSSIVNPNYAVKVTQTSRNYFEVFSYVSAIIPGYVAAFISKEKQILHGLIVGALLGVAIVLFWAVTGVLSGANFASVLYYPIIVCVLATFGGWVRRFQVGHKNG